MMGPMMTNELRTADLAPARFTMGTVAVIVWTIWINGYAEEVCTSYVPVGDRQYPDGLVLVGGAGYRSCGQVSRDAAIAMATEWTLAAGIERGVVTQ